MKRLLSIVFVFGICANCAGQSTDECDRYGGFTALAGTKTGWFHVEEIGGRWHFVTPEGHARRCGSTSYPVLVDDAQRTNKRVYEMVYQYPSEASK